MCACACACVCAWRGFQLSSVVVMYVSRTRVRASASFFTSRIPAGCRSCLLAGTSSGSRAVPRWVLYCAADAAHPCACCGSIFRDSGPTALLLSSRVRLHTAAAVRMHSCNSIFSACVRVRGQAPPKCRCWTRSSSAAMMCGTEAQPLVRAYAVHSAGSQQRFNRAGRSWVVPRGAAVRRPIARFEFQ